MFFILYLILNFSCLTLIWLILKGAEQDNKWRWD